MAKQVDNRVVEMEFKNKDFEKAVAVTMKSLDDLNKKLDELNKVNMSGFDQMAQKMNNTNFDRLADSIDYIKSRFGLIGIAAQNLKEEIVSNLFEAAQSVGNVFGSIEQTIQEKGKTRATNLAQAKFQLKGLGIEWNKVSDSIDEAVNDTRFGLDEAAMAASQLAASGVALGDEMTHALLGISGVAAMTNSEYSDMAHIFTTVAGTGKLYTQQLNMIASRGLNAAAAIANYMTEMRGSLVTEADVRQMLSSKDDFIDFSTFAEAMWHEYGAQAKKGNDLFSGAFANAKAALGRIGEKFYTPFYEYARQTLVAVKPVINDLNAALTPFFTSLDKAMENTKNVAVHVLGEIHKMFTGDDGNDYSINLFGKTISAKNDFAKVVDWAKTIVEGFGATLNGSNGVMSIAGEALANIFYNLYEILISIGGAISDVFGAPSVNGIIYYLSVFRDWTEEVRLSDEQLESLKSTVRGITSALDILLKTGLSIYKVFIRPLLESIGLVKDSVFDVTGTIGDLLYDFDQDYDPFVGMYNTFHRLLEDLSPLTDGVKFLLNALKTGFANLTGITSLEELVNAIGSTLSSFHITDIVGGLFYGIGYAIQFAANAFSAFEEAVEADDTFTTFKENIIEQSKVLSWLRDTFTNIKNTIKDLFAGKITLTQALGLDKLAEKFAFINPLIEKFKEHYKSIFEVSTGSDHNGGLPFIAELGEKLKTSIRELQWEDIFGMIGAAFYAYWIKKKEQIAEAIAKSVTTFSDAFKSLTENINLSLVKMTKETKAEAVLKIAAAVALLAGSVFILASIDPSKLWTAIGAIAVLTTIMVGFVKLLDLVNNGVREISRTSQTMTDPGSTKKTVTKGGKKNPVTTVVEKLAATLTETQETIKEKINNFGELPMLLLSFAASIALISLSLGYLTAAYDANPEAFKGAAKTLAIIFAALIAVAALFAVLANQSFAINPVTVAAMSKLFLAMAFALDLIVFPIIALTALLALTKNNEVGAAVALAMAMLLGLAAIAGFFSVFVNACTTGPMLAGAGAMMMMAAAINILTIPVIALTALLAKTKNNEVGAAVALVAALLIGLAAIASLFAIIGSLPSALAGMLAGAGAMIMMALAIQMLMIPIAAITALAATDINSLMAALGVISILMLVMFAIAGLFAVITTATAGIGAAGMLAGALAMIMMAKAIQALIVPLAAFTALSNSGGGFGNAIKQLAEALVLLGLAAIGAIVVAPGLSIMIGLLTGLATVIWIFADALYHVGKGALDFVMALATLQAISLDGLSDKIAQAGKAMIEGFRTALTAGQADIQDGFVALLAAGLGALTGSLGMITETIILLLYDIIQAIDNHAQPLGYALGHAISDILWYAAAGAIASTGDFFGKILGLENGNGISDWLKDRLMNEKSDKKGILQKLKSHWFGDKEDIKKEIADPAGEEISDEIYTASAESMEDEGNKQQLTKATEENIGGALNDACPGILSNSNLPDILKQYVGDGVDGYEGALDVQNGKSLLYEGSTEYITAGAVSGIEKGTPDYENAIAKMAKSGNKRFLKENNMASPSKLYAQYGEYIDQGLAMGIDKSDASEESIANRSTALASVFSNIGETAKNSIGGNILSPLSAAISSLTSDISEYEEYQPTIAPVFDMSNVTDGFNTLNSMFSNQRSISLASDVASLDSANRMLNLQIQNDNRNGLNNNIDSLGAKLDSLGESILSRQIVLDSGQLVGGLVNPMDQQLGVRAILAQRGG